MPSEFTQSYVLAPGMSAAIARIARREGMSASAKVRKILAEYLSSRAAAETDRPSAPNGPS